MQPLQDGYRESMLSSLKDRFPELFIENSSDPSVGDGWLPIIERLCETIYPIIMKQPDACDCGYAESDHPVYSTQTGHKTTIHLRKGPIEADTLKVVCDTYEPMKACFLQIKQKFSDLVVYMKFRDAKLCPGNDRVREAITEAAIAAGKTCEGCGQNGDRTAVGGWSCILCHDCETFERARREGWKIAVLG